MRKRRWKETLERDALRKKITDIDPNTGQLYRKLDFGKITETYIGIDPGYPGAGPAG